MCVLAINIIGCDENNIEYFFRDRNIGKMEEGVYVGSDAENILDLLVGFDGGAEVVKYTNDHNAPATKDNVTKVLIPDKPSECALGVAGDTCTSDKTVHVVADVIGDKSNDAKTVMENAKKKLDCDTERCVLKKLIPQIGEAVVRGEIANNFKVVGPTDNKLLSNVNIDTTLRQWATKFRELYPYNFNMLNYASYSYRDHQTINSPDTLATIQFSDWYERGFRCAACVINSDTYQGPGKHWMALFADTRGDKWTVEFFNSSGNPPAPEWVNWLVKTQAAMREINPNTTIVRSSSFRHQQSRTECGVYSLFYIWARLNNTPVEYFSKNPIPDQLMFEFRQHLFEDPNRKSGGRFDWDEYRKKVNVTWE